jgi:hypothetical protein
MADLSESFVATENHGKKRFPRRHINDISTVANGIEK